MDRQLRGGMAGWNGWERPVSHRKPRSSVTPSGGDGGWRGDAAQKRCCSPSAALHLRPSHADGVWAGASRVACTCGLIRSPPNGFGGLGSPAWSPPEQDSGGSRE